MGTLNTYDVVHWYKIKVIDEKRNIVETMGWSGLLWELRLKYEWYFRYRAALLQVKYPKYEVQTFWGNEPAVGKSLDDVKQNKIKAKKAKITKFKNKLERYKEEWNSMFPVEQDLHYQNAVNKINKLEFELRTFENQ